MNKVFAWLVRHEKLVAALTLALVAALVMQLNYCRPRAPGELTLQSGAEARPPDAADAPPREAGASLAGVWEMSVRKRGGGAQQWTLTLAQDGETLRGFIRSEGGDLPLTGTVKNRSVNFSATKMGVTVEFAAAFDGEKLEGTMRTLTVERRWTARRK